MKRRWNISLWVGFIVVLSALLTYVLVFVRFPATRDFPWATLLIFGAGLLFMAVGLRRAYREPQLYRGKISGPILMILGLGLVASFGWGVFYAARQLPPPASALQIGQRAPDFALLDEDGHTVRLSALFGSGVTAARRTNAVLLIFYRGDW